MNKSTYLPTGDDNADAEDELEDIKAEAERQGMRKADQFDLANMSPFELSVYLDDQRRERRAEIENILAVCI